MTFLAIKRKLVNALSLSLSTLLAIFALFWLAWLLITLFRMGFQELTWSTLTKMTLSPGSDGGLYNAIIGSLIITMTALLLASPIGILVGIFLAEYHPVGRITTSLRFLLEILLGVPSILIGLFIYQIYVVHIGHFSGWAGCFALGLMVIPITALTTENVYRLVPSTLKEAVLALGASKWILVRFMIISVLKTQIITGILLAFSRISGEAAPLLFTALNNAFWSLDMNRPMSNLPNTIFSYAMSPYADWQRLAWTGLLLITLYVLFINLVCRFLIKRPTY